MELAELSEKNPKAFHRRLSNLRKAGGPILQIQASTGMTNTDIEAADLLAEYFSSIHSTAIDPTNPAQILAINSDTDARLSEVLFDARTITTKLNKLRSNISPGPDNIPAIILKKCAEAISHPLSQIFQRSMDTSSIPAEWKRHTTMPFYKNGSRKIPGNYRPIALMPIAAKIMETIIDDSIRKFVYTNQKLSVHQHGFSKGKSVITNLLTSLDDWTKSIDEGLKLDAIYFDISKAFDTVNHNLLLIKLRSTGISGNLLKWLHMYVVGRQFQVRVNRSFSKWMEIDNGVPQGSILGPLLFLIFINDLPNHIDANITLFADDAKIWGMANNVQERMKLQKAVDTFQTWATSNGLRLNEKKCKVVHLNHNDEFPYTINTNPIESSKLERDLGTLVASNMCTTANSRLLTQRATGSLNLIKRTVGQLERATFNRIYKNIVRPHLEWNTIVSPPILAKDDTSLEKVQRKATKSVRGLGNLPYEERLQKLDLFSLSFRRIRGDLIFAHKILTNPNHPNRNLLQLSPIECSRGHDLKLVQESCKSRIRSTFFSNRVVPTWNRLPAFVIESTSTEEFKERLDKHARKEGALFTRQHFYQGNPTSGSIWGQFNTKRT